MKGQVRRRLSFFVVEIRSFLVRNLVTCRFGGGMPSHAHQAKRWKSSKTAKSSLTQRVRCGKVGIMYSMTANHARFAHNHLARLPFSRLMANSLPYINNSLKGLKVKNRLKRKVFLQNIFEPIQSQSKQAFINSVRTINQTSFL